MYNKIGSNPDKTIEQVKSDIINTSDLIEKINTYKEEIDVLIVQRSDKPARISLAEMPTEQRYNKLKQEGKKFKNAILMLSYRAETALYNTVKEFFKEADKQRADVAQRNICK